MRLFDHEKLDVYRVAMEFLVVSDELARTLPKDRSYLRQQLRRAASSIALNIAEGAGEFSFADKQRFYRFARRSATECAASLDVCARLGLIESEPHTRARALLQRTVSMLVAMTKRSPRPSEPTTP